MRLRAKNKTSLLQKINSFCWYAQTTSNVGNSRFVDGAERRPGSRRENFSYLGRANSAVFTKCAILLVFVAQSMPYRCKSCMEFLFWVSMELYIPQTTKMAPFKKKMHNLMTERIAAAPWPRRNAGVVHRSDGYLGNARCSSQCLILVRNGVFGGYGRGLTQNDGRTPRKLVDKDRNAVGRVQMRVGCGFRYHSIRVACISAFLVA